MRLSSVARTAVLLIDVQNEWFHPEGGMLDYAPTNGPELLASIRALVAWAHENDVPVIWVRLAFRPGHFDAVRDSISRRRNLLVEGTLGANLVDGLGRRDDDIVITKRRPSAFYATDLDIVLRGLSIDRLIVRGMATNWAVESTVREGHTRDYEMVVVREATGSSDAALHEAALTSMAAVYAEVISVEAVTHSEL
jgi:ureidoacrylate peracid hydrolase